MTAYSKRFQSTTACGLDGSSDCCDVVLTFLFKSSDESMESFSRLHSNGQVGGENVGNSLHFRRELSFCSASCRSAQAAEAPDQHD
jgi:hypothetical protein